MTAPTLSPAEPVPSVADFLADASDRLESTALLLSARRWEQIDPVAALRELHRAVAALHSAVRELAGPHDTETGEQP